MQKRLKKCSPTTVRHIPNKIRINAAKCESSRIDAQIREKPLRDDIISRQKNGFSREHWTPTQITHYCSYQTTCPQGSINLMGTIASLPAQTNPPVPTGQEA
jgi:hypothetical protein